MSSRCRSCHLLTPPLISVDLDADATDYPPTQRLAELVPFTRVLMDAAAEYDSPAVNQGELTPAVEFVRFVDFEARRAAAYGDASPTRADGRPA